jgi:3-oxoacyl-[acyl-carrier-protein] synthase II
MRLAITGTGVISPIAISSDGFVEALLAGRRGIRPAPWSSETAPALFGRVHDDFDAGDWLDDRLVRGTDGFARFALAACDQAVAGAGLGRVTGPDRTEVDAELDPLRTAVVHGTSMGGLFSLGKAQWRLDTEGPEAVDPKTQIKIWCNMAAAQICMRYGLHGPSMTVTTACASSLDALGTAAMYLEAGLADVALVGATEGGYTCDGPDEEGFVLATSAAEASYGMSSGAVDPSRAMLPFDAERAGIVSGEGSAFLVLETEAHAAGRGAQIQGWLTGYASLADGHHPSSPEPSGRWEARVMELAQRSARRSPTEIDAVVAHATGTPKGDQAEIRAINQVFVDGGNDRLAVTGLKGHTGHTGASSGAMNAIAALHAIGGGGLVNVAGTTTLDPEIRFDVVLDRPRPVGASIVQVNSFGFGGQNASIVLEGS